MMHIERLAGVPGWIAHRIFANYWFLAVTAVAFAFPVALFLLWLDRNGATAAIIDAGLVPVANAETARDFLGVAAGINAAFVTLYFSITLLVLSLASSNLGVRLIDRWLERRFIRLSLAGLSFSLVVTLIAMLTVDAKSPIADVPLLLLASVVLLQVLNLAMLSVSLHGLGRTMFVDASIDSLSKDACARSLDLVGTAPRSNDAYGHVMRSAREGYIESVDTEGLRKAFGPDNAVRVEVAPGQHVLKGEVLLRSISAVSDKRQKSMIAIGAYRSDAQGVVFRIRLIVEIAARALSPAINDFYTALACADKLAAVIESQSGTWVEANLDPAEERAPWIALIGQDFRGLFEDPLNAFRQAACQYPSVAIRMIGNYGRLAQQFRSGGQSAQLIDFIALEARQLRDHSASVSQYDHDRDDIYSAYEHWFSDRQFE